MRNARLFLFLTLTSFLLFGCPYNSEVALSTADSKAGEFLVGSWELPESSGSVVRITKGTGNLLNIEKTEAGYDGRAIHYQLHSACNRDWRKAVFECEGRV